MQIFLIAVLGLSLLNFIKNTDPIPLSGSNEADEFKN